MNIPKLYISIDFSLESTGICFYDTKMNHYKMVSFLNIREKPVEKRVDMMAQSILPHAFEVSKFRRLPVSSPKKVGLCSWERQHLNNVVEYGTMLVNRIKNEISQYYSSIEQKNIVVIIENYSYQSLSDTFIQIIENTLFVKQKLIEKVCLLENFHIVPSPSVKQYVGKGNYDKYDLLKAFVHNIKDDIDLKKSGFWKWIVINKELFIKERKKKDKVYKEILTPLSDIVDAYWIMKYFRDNEKADQKL